MNEYQAHTFSLIGGALCLDFTNTASERSQPQLVENLTSYARLVSWGQQVDILTDDEAQNLLDEAALRPAEASAVLERAIVMREQLWRLFSAATSDDEPQSEDINAFNGHLADALAQSQIVATDEGFAWAWRSEPQALDSFLWPVVRSAADILTDDNLVRVSECSGDVCDWLFLDTSRNHSRHWCEMKTCGNRAKARRHYQRRNN